MDEFQRSTRPMGMAVLQPASDVSIESLRSIVENDFASIDVAAINSDLQLTISGLIESLREACQRLVSGGVCRSAKLLQNVELAFHSRWMKQAQVAFEEVLRPTQFKPASLGTFVSNATASPVLIVVPTIRS